MRTLLIKNGNIVSEGKIRKADILVIDGVIAEVGFINTVIRECELIDATDRYVSAGFIDMHVHGGAGRDIMDLDVDAFKEISHIHLINGTTTMLPTAVSSKFEDIVRLIEVYGRAKDLCPNFYGLHLEGPFISKKQKGAHKEYLLHAPSIEEIDTIAQIGKGSIKRITAAPELENSDYLAEKMQKNNVLMSVGHSDATSAVASRAFEKGFSLVTHFYNATTSVRKIDQEVVAGIQEAALLNEDVSIEIIGDGKHTAVEAVRLAVKVKGTDRVALITDALRPTGLNLTESYLGEKTEENRIIIEDGVAKLPDRSSYAGSIATTNILLKKGVEHYGFSLVDTVKMLTETPANILGIENKAKIKKGYVADIVVFDRELNVQKVILGGRCVR